MFSTIAPRRSHAPPWFIISTPCFFVVRASGRQPPLSCFLVKECGQSRAASGPDSHYFPEAWPKDRDQGPRSLSAAWQSNCMCSPVTAIAMIAAFRAGGRALAGRTPKNDAPGPPSRDSVDHEIWLARAGLELRGKDRRVRREAHVSGGLPRRVRTARGVFFIAGQKGGRAANYDHSFAGNGETAVVMGRSARIAPRKASHSPP